MDHFWISIRSSILNNKFDIPRWHYDGFYFSNVDNQAKFAFVLKGPGTLFIKKSKKVIESYNKIQDKYRKELNEIIDKNIIRNNFVKYNIYERLVVEGINDSFRLDLEYNDENLLDNTFKLIFRQPIRRL